MQAYHEQKTLIEEAMEKGINNGDIITDPGDVEKLVEVLGGLKHNGGMFKDLRDCVKRSNDNHQFHETQVAPPKLRYRSARSSSHPYAMKQNYEFQHGHNRYSPYATNMYRQQPPGHTPIESKQQPEKKGWFGLW